MSMQKVEERAFLLKCIKVYQSLPALWDMKSTDYTNRLKKNEAYNTLVSVYQELYPQATKEEVKKRFNSLRTNWRKELNKIKKSKMSGFGGEDVYEPTLWYFDAMKFLYETEAHALSLITSPDDSQEQSEAQFNITHKNHESMIQIGHQNDTHIVDVKQEMHVPSSSTSRSLLKRTHSNESVERTIETVEPSVINKRYMDEDRCDYFGRLIAIKLRSFSKEQMIIAEKLINDVMFEAELGRLTLEHSLTGGHYSYT